MKYNIDQLLKVLTPLELTTLDALLIDVGNSGSSPRSQNRLHGWMNRAATIHGIANPITPCQRRRSLSI